MIRIRSAALLVVFAIASPAARAQPAQDAPDDPAVATASRLFVNLDYEGCVKHVESALAQPRDSREIAQLHLFRALCEHGLGQEDAATSHLQVALALDPTLRAPEWASPRVHAFVDGVATKFAEASGRAPPPADAPTQTQAPSEAQVGVSPSGASPTTIGSQPPDGAAADSKEVGAVTAAPQPERTGLKTARWALSGTAAALGVAGLGFGVRARSLEQEFQATPWMNERERLSTDARQSATVANVAYGLAASAAIAAAVTWFLSEAQPASSEEAAAQ